MKLEIESVRNEELFIEEIAQRFPDDEPIPNSRTFDTSQLEHPIFLAAIPGFKFDPKERYSLIVAYQALRLAALLHDLGHPPFSHVTELALDELYDALSESEDLTPSQEGFLRIVGGYRNKPTKFHEELGLFLAKHVLGQALSGVKRGSYFSYHFLTIKNVALGILQDRPGVLTALHRIVDSELDSDRLDYVPRDLSMSGIAREPLRFDRLFTSFQLVYPKSADKASAQTRSSVPEFVPSVRALSTIEEFFQRRLNLYKYVVYHHRVAKTDGLLKEIIKDLAMRALSREGGRDVIVGERPDHTLPLEISGLWAVLDRSRTTYPIALVKNYIQWDDAWLLSVLRKHYFELEQSGTGQEQGRDRSLLEVRLEEVLSSKANYVSLYKRGDSFLEIDQAFLSSAVDGFDWEELRVQLHDSVAEDDPRISKSIDFYVNRVVEYFEEFREASRQEDSTAAVKRLRELRGFFVVTLFQALKSAGKSGGQNLAFAEIARQEILRAFDLQDVLLIPKSLGSGVENSFHLVKDNEIVSLGDISRIADDLQRSSGLFPPFYVYIYKPEGLDEKELSDMRALLGSKLWFAFMSWLRTDQEGETHGEPTGGE